LQGNFQKYEQNYVPIKQLNTSETPFNFEGVAAAAVASNSPMLFTLQSQPDFATTTSLTLSSITQQEQCYSHENKDIKNCFIQQLARQVEISTMTSLFKKVPHTKPRGISICNCYQSPSSDIKYLL